MAPNDSTPVNQREVQPPEARDDSQIVLSDTVISGVIRESVRRHVPVVQVVAERRGELPPPPPGESTRRLTSGVPASCSFWSRCLRWFRKRQ